MKPVILRGPRWLSERDFILPDAHTASRVSVIQPIISVVLIAAEGLGGREERFTHIPSGRVLKSTVWRMLGPENYAEARRRGLVLDLSHEDWTRPTPLRLMARWAARTFPADPDARRAWLMVFVSLYDTIVNDAPARAFAPASWLNAEHWL